MQDFHDFAMELLAWKKGNSARQFALMFNGTTFVGCAQSTLDARPVTGTAIVNLLQSALDQDINVQKAWVYSSAIPTFACKGMMRLQTRGGKIIYDNSGLKCYDATRTDSGMTDTFGSAYSSNDNAWDHLKRGGKTLGVWFTGVKNETLGNKNYKPFSELAPKAAKAAKAVESLAVWNGRSSGSLNKFFDPTGVGVFDIVADFKTQDEKDAFFALLVQELVYRLRGRAPDDNNVSKTNQGHNIGSLLVDSGWRVVGWGVNTNKTNGSFHGETNTIQAQENLGKKALPTGGTLYTSLEPCEMCSGVIRNALAMNDNGFRVIYLQPDETLAYTALNDENSPITMEPAKVALDVKSGSFGKGQTYVKELQGRQEDLIYYQGDRYKAPTTFLKHSDAVNVFRIAGEQRLRVATPLAEQRGKALALTQAHNTAVTDQALDRARIKQDLINGRHPSTIRKYGIRDDMALLNPNSRTVQDLYDRQQLLGKLYVHDKTTHSFTPTGYKPTRLEREQIGTLDDSSLMVLQRDLGDPYLLLLARELDKLSERFRTVYDTWLKNNGASKTSSEKLRLLKQITGFLDQAVTSVYK